MYKTCVSKQAIARQRTIEYGLLDFMSHKSYEDITVIDLCEKLGIPRKAFYRYFSNKDGALHALIDHALHDALNQFQDAIAKFESRDEILLHFFTFWLDEKKLLDVLASNDLSGILLQRAISFTLTDETVSKYLSFLQGTQRAKRYRTIFLISGIMSLVVQWHHNHFDKSPQQMAALASDLLP